MPDINGQTMIWQDDPQIQATADYLANTARIVCYYTVKAAP